jgi:acyl-CoA thioesterase FadM
MSKAIISQHWQALTAELRVRFRARVSPGEKLQVRGWIKDRRKRRIQTEAILTTERGQELAHAWATFLTVPDPERIGQRLPAKPARLICTDLP